MSKTTKTRTPLIALIELKLELTNIGFTHVSRISSLLAVLAKFLIHYIFWSEWKVLRKSWPKCFQKKHKSCICIVASREILIFWQLNLNTRAQTRATFRNHNTIKQCTPRCAPACTKCTPAVAVSFLRR